MAPDTTAHVIDELDAARRDIGSRIAWLAVQAIAQLARAADPEIATIRLRYDQSGDAVFMGPGRGFYAADGTDLAEADLPAPACLARAYRSPYDTAAILDRLTEQIRPFCTWLDETNAGTWLDVTTELDAAEPDLLMDDGDKRLFVGLALSLAGPPAAGDALYLPIPVHGVDARHSPQPHPCASAWQYDGRNAGGHEIFTCTSGHRLIAPHPSGLHACAAACAGTEIPAPHPA
ncbi:MAG: hypothetical protein ACRDRJ_12730 [Streptosporangiaceae bacterium]